MTIPRHAVRRIVEKCRAALPLDSAWVLPPVYFYRHLPLAVIDAVFSIGAVYRSTENTVLRFARHFDTDAPSCRGLGNRDAAR